MCFTSLVYFTVISSFICYYVSASAGDKSKFFQNCVYDCKREICETGLYKPPFLSILGIGWSPWTCTEDCEYDCQWKTVDGFIERKWKVPQFHGKWPFIRMFGLQEPASAIFSMINFIVILQQLHNFRRQVPPDSPYYGLWHAYSFTCLNAWVWSTIYHTRDSDFTERMDYMSATVMVFAAFFAMTVRVLSLKLSTKPVIWGIIWACFLANHLAYLWFLKFDYAYNMTVNIVVGAVTIAGWILWAITTENHPCSSSVAIYSLMIAAATLLELLDFPPFLWTFDAHSLWHLSTCFLVIPFYNFIRDDCKYLRSQGEKQLPTLRTKID